MDSWLLHWIRSFSLAAALAVAVGGVSPAQEELPKRAVFMIGYRGYDAPLFTEALEGIGVACEKAEGWVPTADYAKYGIVVIAGGPNMGKASVALPPGEYSAEDLVNLRAFMGRGGNLLLLRYGLRIFGAEGSPAHKWLSEVAGVPGRMGGKPLILRPDHPWVKPLAPGAVHPWLSSGHEEALVLNAGGAIIGTDEKRASLCEVSVGRGRLVYMGWHAFLNKPRGKVTDEVRDAYEEQIQVIQGIAQTLRGVPAGG